MTSSLSTESNMSLSRTWQRRHSVESLVTHTLSDPTTPSPAPCSPLFPPSTFSSSHPLRRGAVLSGSLKPCLYCQRTYRHLPPLEHLVLSCWAWTENSTIGSLMNCYLWTGINTLLCRDYLSNLRRQSSDF